MSDSDPSPMALAATGRFQEALATLARRRQGKSGRMTATERLEFAELLERTGQLAEARDYLAAVNKSSRLSDAERARCLLVEGLLSKQLGHLEESIDRFQQGRRLAERAGSPELLGWCQLRLLGVSADIDGADLSASLLADLRKNTERAATPTISVAYQIFLAEYSAKRGDLDKSKHHSSLAESILATYPNVWLRGLLDLHLSCLNYLEGNYLNSIMAAHRALGTSGKSGNRLTGLIAQADMAAAYLAVGQPARAKACLSSALQRANNEEQIFGLLLETLAEAQLVSGDLVGCAESLRCAHDLSARFSQSRSAWHRAWNLRTEARLLQRSGRWQESLSLIRSAGPRESPDSQPFTRTQIEGLEALALARVGRSVEARGVIQRLVQDTLVAPKLYQGSVYGVAAALSAVADEGGEAIARCTRALRIVGATGETSSLVEIVDQLIGLLSKSSGCLDEPMCPNSQPPLWRPTNVTCHLHASTAVVPETRPALCRTSGVCERTGGLDIGRCCSRGGGTALSGGDALDQVRPSEPALRRREPRGGRLSSRLVQSLNQPGVSDATARADFSSSGFEAVSSLRPSGDSPGVRRSSRELLWDRTPAGFDSWSYNDRIPGGSLNWKR